MQPKISVIIPVYKAEQFLAKCLDSILSQTFENWECLLIDDGSPDNSGYICDKYAYNDSRIIVYHKTNGGVSSARNHGIKKSSGEWIMFVDSDDYIEPETLEVSLKAIGKDVDLVVFGIEENHLYNNTTKSPDLTYIGKEGASIQEELEEADKNGWLQGPVCKLFRRDIIVNNRIFFDPIMSYGEDTKFSFEYFLHCKEVRILHNYLYHYCFRNNDSLTNRKLDWEYTVNLAKMLKDVRTRFAEHFDMPPSYYQFIGFVYASWMTNALSKIIYSNKSEKKTLYKTLVKEMLADNLMVNYHPLKNQSRQYSFYTKFPMIWYYMILFTKQLLG